MAGRRGIDPSKIKVVISHSGRAGKVYHSYFNYKNHEGCVSFGRETTLGEAEADGYRACKKPGCMRPGR